MLIFPSISRMSHVTMTQACFNFNFVNKVEMYVLPFEISDRKYKKTKYFWLKGLLMNHSICPKIMGISLLFFCIEQKVYFTANTFINS